MAIGNTTKHLVFLKAQAKSAAKTVEGMTFFMVLNKKTNEAILHIDPKKEATKFKSPVVIKKQLLRMKALNPAEYAPLFKNPADSVSAAGIVRKDTKGRLAFKITVRSGKASEADMTKALTFFKFINGHVVKKFDGDPEDTEAESTVEAPTWEKVAAKADAMFKDGVTVDAVQKHFYGALGGIDNLVEATALLEEQIGSMTDSPERQALEAKLAAMETVIQTVDALGDNNGVAGLMDGLDDIQDSAALDESTRDLIESVLADIQEIWQGTLKQITGVLTAQVSVLKTIAADLKQEEAQHAELAKTATDDQIRKRAEEDVSKSQAQQNQIGSVATIDNLLAMTVGDVSAVMSHTLTTIGADLKNSINKLDDIIHEMITVRAEIISDKQIRDFDEAFETGLAKTTSNGLDQIVGRLTNLEQKLA